jgi:hypothetical protein
MHNHNCICTHENIKFCTVCRKPYCVDCGQEWEAKCTLIHYNPWTTVQPYIPSPDITYTSPIPNDLIINCCHSE